jgi:hypothetical protein
MTTLSEALNKLSEFLASILTVPESRGFKILEVREHVKTDRAGRLLVRRTELKKPDEFAQRFRELLDQLYPWINVTCFGLFEGDLIVGVEIPRSAERNTRTSVNFSGPPRVVLDHAWDATNAFIIE